VKIYGADIYKYDTENEKAGYIIPAFFLLHKVKRCGTINNTAKSVVVLREKG